jgi:two-component system, LytTR family, sensor kinase
MNSSGHWFFRYKLHHIPLWFAYHFLWWSLRIGSPMDVLYAIFYTPGTAKFFFYLVFQALAVYFNLYYLIPRFLEKGKYVHYVALLLVTVIAAALFIVSGYYVGAWVEGRPLKEVYGVEPGDWYTLFEGGALQSTAASMTLAMSIKLASDWLQSRRREKEMEKEKLETELKFLRSQFNPHFLFNTINSIFVLIHKNPDSASQALAKFSDLLRYQLYECTEDEIPLRHEIQYLSNFIELEKLRHSTDRFDLAINITDSYRDDLCVAPFVLIPFVENAFKHVSRSKDHHNFIKIDLSTKDQQLIFNVTNSVRQQNEISRELIAHKGIGLKNVRRRLELIYGQAFELTTTQQGEQFIVKLVIALHQDQATTAPNTSAVTSFEKQLQ